MANELSTAFEVRDAERGRRATAALSAYVDTCPRVSWSFGALFVRAGQLEQAEEAFTRAIAVDPLYTQAYLARATLKVQREPDGALSDLAAALNGSGDPQELYDVRALRWGIFSDRSDGADLAIAEATAMIQLDPSWPDAYQMRGWIREKQEDWASALADYEVANSADSRQLGGPETMPDFRASNFMGMARAKLALGDSSGARADANAALELATGAEDRQSVEVFLAELEGR